MQKGFLNLGLIVVLAIAISLSLYALDSGFLTLNTNRAYTDTQNDSATSCPLYNRFFGKCPAPAPTMCEYANPPAGCSYVPGPDYDPATQCGLVLSCSDSGTQPTPKITSPAFKSGIAGTVTYGPTCPGPVGGVGCEDQPYQGEFVVTSSLKDTIVARFNTDANGYYAVSLPAGNYTIRATAGRIDRQSFDVTVRGDTVTQFNFTLDSGLR